VNSSWPKYCNPWHSRRDISSYPATGSERTSGKRAVKGGAGWSRVRFRIFNHKRCPCPAKISQQPAAVQHLGNFPSNLQATFATYVSVVKHKQTKVVASRRCYREVIYCPVEQQQVSSPALGRITVYRGY
jgi:hypothetical protein